MSDTLQALDEAIQRHIGEVSEGALTDGWSLVTHSTQVDESDPISGYRIITSDTQPYHVDAGLIEVGKHIIRGSWDAALDDDDD
jgi:hypothetical protein